LFISSVHTGICCKFLLAAVIHFRWL